MCFDLLGVACSVCQTAVYYPPFVFSNTFVRAGDKSLGSNFGKKARVSDGQFRQKGSCV
jgi:hypothetical protein